MKDTAILVTTFLRDSLLYRCIESIRQYYPKTAIFVGDNGKPSKEKTAFCDEHKCTLISLPFDLGVAGVRNASLRKIPKRYTYIVICEDDIIFTAETRLETWRAVLDAEPGIGMAGGCLKVGTKATQHYEADTWIEGKTHYIRAVTDPAWKTLGVSETRYFICDLILNVFLMRREVWEEVQWDDQFKTAFEHSDFFLRLKYEQDENGYPVFNKNGTLRKRRRPIRAAYVPSVWAYHNSKGEGDDYAGYRLRPMGWTLFARKWSVEWSDSTFNKGKNPLNLHQMGLAGYNIKDENLELAIRILEKHGCTWWLEAGTCLGAVRERDFLAHDADIDIGIMGKHVDLWNTLQAEFKEAGFVLYHAWEHDGRKTELSFEREKIKLDLFFFYRSGEFMWHGIFGPDNKGRWGFDNLQFLPCVFSASLFENLQEVVFRGKRCFLPNPADQYLTERYGPEWRRPNLTYKYYEDCRAIDRHFFKRQKTVFAGGVWDLFHHGHLQTLKEARRFGKRLVVGVMTDEAASANRDKPTVPFEHRLKLISDLGLADKVVALTDRDPTADLKAAKVVPHYIVHGDNWLTCAGGTEFGARTILLPYDTSISTTEIKRWAGVRAPVREKDTGQKHKDDTIIAIGIKTLMREDLLFRTLETIKREFPYRYHLYIADDGPVSIKKEYLYQELKSQGHTIIKLPQNAGISHGRNSITAKVVEDYVLIMDDDILLSDPESITKMKAVLDNQDDIGIASCQIYTEAGQFYQNENWQKGLRFEERTGLLLRTPALGEIKRTNGGILYRLAHQVVNCFLAKTAVFKDAKWDNQIKVEYEHMDFFLSLMKKTRWKVAVCFDTRAVHQTATADYGYNRFRRAGSPFYFLSKWNFVAQHNQF